MGPAEVLKTFFFYSTVGPLLTQKVAATVWGFRLQREDGGRRRSVSSGGTTYVIVESMRETTEWAEIHFR